MTSLDKLRLCAEALELPLPYVEKGNVIYCGAHLSSGFGGSKAQTMTGGLRWNPLDDDAQAMALVKKLNMSIKNIQGTWHVLSWGEGSKGQALCFESGASSDLNVAIVDCAARVMQGRKG